MGVKSVITLTPGREVDHCVVVATDSLEQFDHVVLEKVIFYVCKKIHFNRTKQEWW
jgi:hypothetical protein